MPHTACADQDDDEAFDREGERPLPRSRRRLPWFRMALFSGLCIAALAYLAQQEAKETVTGAPHAVPAAVLVAPPPAWTALNPAHGPYGLDRTFGPASAEARRHSGGGREDTLTVGAPGDGRYARVTFSHRTPSVTRTFYLDMVLRAAEAGLAVERNGQTRLLQTKFGPVETAALTLAGPEELACDAFRFRDESAVFGFQGWLCAPDGLPDAPPQRLACFIDAMTFASAEGPGGADAALPGLFGGSGRSCSGEARTAMAGKPEKAPPPPPKAVR